MVAGKWDKLYFSQILHYDRTADPYAGDICIRSMIELFTYKIEDGFEWDDSN